MGDTILYFGCRKSQEDFLYREELEQYVKDGTLTLHTAFSREQEHKVYVTHLLEKNKEELWRVIGEQNGHIYVCGLVRSSYFSIRIKRRFDVLQYVKCVCFFQRC